MTNRALIIVIATALLAGGPRLFDRSGQPDSILPEAAAASPELPRTPQTEGPIDARLHDDLATLKKFRPGFEFWQHVYRIPDGSIAFGSAEDGRLLAVFPVSGDWTRAGRWSDKKLARILEGRDLPASLDDRREYVAHLLQGEVGPVLHNFTRGGFLKPGARRYGPFLQEWGAIYERFGVPAEIGLAQAVVESGFEGRRRSEADAVGLCQWLESNWDHLDRLDPVVIESGNQTTQAAYCAAYVSVLATKYRSFLPALSEHHAGATNVGRILVSGGRLGGGDARERYFLGADFARDLRTIAHEDYGDIYESYGPRSYRYAEMIFGNALTVRSIVAAVEPQRIHAMRTTRSLPIKELATRTGLSLDELRRFNPALVKTVPAGATLYLPTFVAAFGRDVTFWHRPASAAYAAVLDEFVRLDASPEEWDTPRFQPILKEFVRRFEGTNTQEGSIMATVLTYVRQDLATSPRRGILAEFANSPDIRSLFERGVHDRETFAALAAE